MRKHIFYHNYKKDTHKNLRFIYKLLLINFSNPNNFLFPSFPVLLLIFEILIRPQRPYLNPLDIDLLCPSSGQRTISIGLVVTVVNCALVDILVDP